MDENIKELCNALKPFADLMEYPQEWGSEFFLAHVDPKDIIEAKRILEKYEQ